jgi:hypothetical protein
MGDRPPLSILIPWYDRDELHVTLAANEPVFRAHNAEILILNCGGNRERLRGLITASKVAALRQIDLCVPAFNKCLALNAGLAYAKADTVFTLDADVVLLDPLPVEAVDGGSFVTIESVYESAPVSQRRAGSAIPSPKEAFLELAFRDGVKVRHQFGLRDASGNIRAGTGLLLARKCDLLTIGGYNSDLDSWGWEDDDVLVRLQYVLKRRRTQTGAALHLTHGNNRRFLRGSRTGSNQRNFIKCCRNYNNGVFFGSYHADMSKLSAGVAEPPADSTALEEAPAAIVHSRLSGPFDCGKNNGMIGENAPDASDWPPSISALLLEAALLKCPLDNCDVLEIRSAGSRLAARLSARCRQYSQSFREVLPPGAYDRIIDAGLMSDACCQRHLRTLLENYSSVLAPAGWLATVEPGLDGAARDNRWRLTETDLSGIAGQCGLRVAKAGACIYKVTRCESSPRASVMAPTSPLLSSG